MNNKTLAHLALILGLKKLNFKIQLYDLQMLQGNFKNYDKYLEDNRTISLGLSILAKEEYDYKKTNS